MTSTQSDFHHSLDRLIATNRKKQREQFQYRNIYSPTDFARAFCTVSCDAGRMTGKTEFIRRNSTDRDAIITLNEDGLSAKFADCRAKIATARTFHRLAMQAFLTVYVDDASYVFQVADRDELIALFAKGYKTTFVFLG
ncbi:hypothetical protein [Dechloromonas denitrificans]|uniref:hypothetical protein n=1 Tax=Dechloromonas denitrificans TaxID=281362 RepID=UPI001CF886CD|nr:hypothetical protein [Dechloromonas denitrificans]UCV02314.1 hypothetical protein KI611_14605 [Dechloromonas denitrificans]